MTIAINTSRGHAVSNKLTLTVRLMSSVNGGMMSVDTAASERPSRTQTETITVLFAPMKHIIVIQATLGKQLNEMTTTSSCKY